MGEPARDRSPTADASRSSASAGHARSCTGVSTDRAAQLFANGLLEEVRDLLDAGHGPQLRPMSGHGYREAAAHLAGEWSLDEAIEITARRTRQYAKRQLTWFRRDTRIMWLPAGTRPGDDPALVHRAHELLRAALG